MVKEEGKQKEIKRLFEEAEKAYNDGNDYAKSKDYKKAISYYEKAIELNPADEKSYNNLGNVYYELKDYNKAIFFYEKAVAINANDAISYNNLGLLYTNLGSYQKALLNFKKSIILNPKNASIYYHLGNVYFNLANYQQALSYYNKALKLNPKNANIYYYLGSAYYQLQDYEQALKYYIKTIELNTTEELYFNNLGAIYGILEKKEDALLNFNEAIKLNPKYADAYYNRALIYTALKEHIKAYKDYEKAAELAPHKYGDFYTDEETDEEENSNLNIPFAPEEIQISTKVVSCDTYLRRYQQGTIILNPDFQRNEVWKETQKSRLIESMMLKIPLPMFYVAADTRDNYTVVDGLQRLSTLRDFVLGSEFLETGDLNKKGQGFPLKNLEFWHEYEDKTFNELPIYLQNRIIETEFIFTIITAGTPEEVKRNIFKRINTSGTPLSSQEIRHALYNGKATELLEELSKLDSFQNATKSSVKSERMEDKELILRFLAFLIRDYKTYQKTLTADTFLSDTMMLINAMPSFRSRDFRRFMKQGKSYISIEDIGITDINLMKQHFDTAMQRAFALFGKHSFRKSYREQRRRPINKSLFEIWGVLLCKLSEAEFQLLLSRKEELMDSYIPIMNMSSFQTAISRDSMKRYPVKYRFETIEKLINKYIK